MIGKGLLKEERKRERERERRRSDGSECQSER
jgi:hypothetical protein